MKLRSIHEIEVLSTRKTFASSSGGILDVSLLLTKQQFDEFLEGGDGFRFYQVYGAKRSALSSGDYHDKAKEIVYVHKGSVLWELEDIVGGTAKYTLTEGQFAFYFSPRVFHKYSILEDDTHMQVFRNVMDVDTYRRPEFEQLKQQVKVTD